MLCLSPDPRVKEIFDIMYHTINHMAEPGEVLILSRNLRDCVVCEKKICLALALKVTHKNCQQTMNIQIVI